MPRRFPPPWSAEGLAECFVLSDQAGQKLAYVYYEDEPGWRRKNRVPYHLLSCLPRQGTYRRSTIHNLQLFKLGTGGMSRHWGLSDKKKLHSAVRTAIGKGLKTRYEVPQNLPHRLLTALMQLGGWNQKNATSRERDRERKRRKVSSGALFRRGR